MEEKDYRKKYFQVYSRILAGLLTVFGFYYLFRLNHPPVGLTGIVLGPLCFMSSYLIKRSGWYNICTQFLVCSSYLFVLIIVVCTGGANSWMITWLVAGPVLSGFLAGRKTLILWGLFTICSLVALFWFDEFVRELPYQITDPKQLDAIHVRSVFFPIIMNILVTSFYLKLIDRSQQAAQEKTKAIRNLLRLVTHDIANPLSVINAASHVQLRSIKDKDSKEARPWQKVMKAGTTIQHILEQVRQLEALGSGKAAIKLEPVSLKEVFEKGKFIFQQKLDQKNLQLVYESPSDDIKVLAEETSLSNQVLNNILSNAIKFSYDNDTILVKVEQREDFVYLVIRDKGIGIPPDILDKLFDERAQTSRKGVSGEEGTGFGMPLVKFFMDRYGGKIDVLSKVQGSSQNTDHGTEFILKLKKADIQPQDDEQKRA